ncbi:hypothetical protein [Aurantimonas sp. Leaf443]|uniref:hypothetical protein n=1 Tax=Aurantimonas sp. Leaf443 TaxID=1736378 RepID=UPI000A690B4D|nr:hypothetical protein [Aurantimonas sp. Leaf443]
MSISATFPRTARVADRVRTETLGKDRDCQPLNAARGIMVAAGLSSVFWISLAALLV